MRCSAAFAMRILACLRPYLPCSLMFGGLDHARQLAMHKVQAQWRCTHPCLQDAECSSQGSVYNNGTLIPALCYGAGTPNATCEYSGYCLTDAECANGL